MVNVQGDHNLNDLPLPWLQTSVKEKRLWIEIIIHNQTEIKVVQNLRIVKEFKNNFLLYW